MKETNGKRKIEKNLLDLKYHRYLEKGHTFYNSLITITLGILAIVATGILAKQIKFSFEIVYYMVYPIATVWIIFIPLITLTRIKRIEVRKQLRRLIT